MADTRPNMFLKTPTFFTIAALSIPDSFSIFQDIDFKTWVYKYGI